MTKHLSEPYFVFVMCLCESAVCVCVVAVCNLDKKNVKKTGDDETLIRALLCVCVNLQFVFVLWLCATWTKKMSKKLAMTKH